MSSLEDRPTTLAEERRAWRLQSQQFTAPAPTRVHADTYYDSSSSEEEDPEPYSAATAAATTGTTSAAITGGNLGEEDKPTAEQEKAALEAEYANAVKKRPRRIRPTLKVPTLTDSEKGLSLLLHQQPKLRKPHTVAACALYTRQLFRHYQTVVRTWYKGAPPQKEAYQWMNQVERLSSQKEMRDHLQSLRQVMCRQFVESKVGLEKADRYWEQLAMEETHNHEGGEEMPVAQEEGDAGETEEDGVPMERRMTRSTTEVTTNTTTVPRVSLPGGIHEEDGPLSHPTVNEDHDGDEPAAKRRRAVADESDEELEFDTTGGTTAGAAGSDTTKRRVLMDDDSDDEDDQKEDDQGLAHEETTMPETAGDPMVQHDATEKGGDEEIPEAASEQPREEEDKVDESLEVAPATETIQSPLAAEEDKPQETGEEHRLDTAAAELEIPDKEMTAASAGQDMLEEEEEHFATSSQLEVSQGEWTQPASQEAGMLLGQATPLSASQSSHESGLFSPVVPQRAPHVETQPDPDNDKGDNDDDAPEGNGETDHHSPPLAETQGTTTTEVEMAETASPPEDETVVPSSPYEDSDMATQDTLIPTMTQDG